MECPRDIIQLLMNLYPNRIWRLLCKKTYSWYRLSPEDEFALSIYYLVNRLDVLELDHFDTPPFVLLKHPLVPRDPELSRRLRLTNNVVHSGPEYSFVEHFQTSWDIITAMCRAYSRKTQIPSKLISGFILPSWNWLVTQEYYPRNTIVLRFLNPATLAEFDVAVSMKLGSYHSFQNNIEWAGFYIYNGWMIDLKSRRKVDLPVQQLVIAEGIASGIYNGLATNFYIRRYLQRFARY